jgi:hypothetical protein
MQITPPWRPIEASRVPRRCPKTFYPEDPNLRFPLEHLGRRWAQQGNDGWGRRHHRLWFLQAQPAFTGRHPHLHPAHRPSVVSHPSQKAMSQAEILKHGCEIRPLSPTMPREKERWWVASGGGFCHGSPYRPSGGNERNKHPHIPIVVPIWITISIVSIFWKVKLWKFWLSFYRELLVCTLENLYF